MLEHADQESGDNVDGRDEDARDCIALRKAGRAVHGAVEFRFGREVLASFSRFRLVNQPGVQVRIDRHLLARQRIQGKARRHFRNSNRAMVDHHVLNRDQYQEDHDTDNVVAADNEVAEGLNHLTGCPRTAISLHKDQTRRRDV